MDVPAIQAKLRLFARDRDWEQYHTPKNLSMALSGEAAELLEIFQWMTPEESLAVKDIPNLKQLYYLIHSRKMHMTKDYQNILLLIKCYLNEFYLLLLIFFSYLIS